MSFTLFLLCLIGCYQLFISLGTEAKDENKYVIVIDAGSTASRVAGFFFHETDTNLELKEDIFEEVKPELSSFADTPSKCSNTITYLLEKAKELVKDKDKQKKTPLALKATAGLRYLGQDKVLGLRNEVIDIFRKSNFYTTDKSFAILDGAYEGLYAWYSVNFLLDRIYGSSQSTVAILDLGGGSTQIAYVTTKISNIECKQDNICLQDITVNGNKGKLYTQSYLGLGLNSARLGILTNGPNEKQTINSDCIHPETKNYSWTYNRVTYSISGPANGKFDINKCKEAIKNYIKIEDVFLPNELKDQEVTAFSYFYDLAVKSGILKESEKKGTTTVKAFEDAAKQACGKLNNEFPFMCVDLSFISLLLVDGYGLNSDKSLTLLKKLKGKEVSWALGAAIDILHNGLGE